MENKYSKPQSISIGVPQGSILGPLLFLIFINDLPRCLQSCEATLHADDTVIYYSSTSITDIEDKINQDLFNVAAWLDNNLLTLNLDKSEFIIIGSPHKLKLCGNVKITIYNCAVKLTTSLKYLGVRINCHLTWSDHIDEIISKCNQRIGILRRVHDLLPLNTRITLYKSLVLSLLDYADIIWGDKDNITLMSDLQILQNKAAKAILGWPVYTSASSALNTLKWKPLSLRRKYHRALFTYKCINDLINFDLNLTSNESVHTYNTRRKSDFRLPIVKTKWGKQRFIYQAIKGWNDLYLEIKKLRQCLWF